MAKKLVSLILSAMVLVTGIISVSAAPKPKTTRATDAAFYIQRFGVIMDEKGDISRRDASFFTPVLYKGALSKGTRPTTYTKLYQEGKVSSDDVIGEIEKPPSDALIFKTIKEAYENTGYILSSKGKVINWSNFNTDAYEMLWYILKLEGDVWHIDGIIIEKETQKPVEIPVVGDPDYVPPEEVEKDDDNDDNDAKAGYQSSFAYIFGYNDATMAADRPLKRSEISAMIHRLVKQNDHLDGFVYRQSNTPDFADIDGAWYRSGIEYMNYKGAFDIEKGENIYPYTTVTRGEAFKMICIGLGFTEDTGRSHEAYAEILKKYGYVQGDENGDLNLPKAITRAEFCTIYNKIIGRENAKLVTADNTVVTAETYGFTDLSEDAWYYDDMLKATSAFDENGFVDLTLRGIRNDLDDYHD